MPNKIRFTDKKEDQYGRHRTGTAERYEAGWHGWYDDEPDLMYQLSDYELQKYYVVEDVV